MLRFILSLYFQFYGGFKTLECLTFKPLSNRIAGRFSERAFELSRNKSFVVEGILKCGVGNGRPPLLRVHRRRQNHQHTEWQEHLE